MTLFNVPSYQPRTADNADIEQGSCESNLSKEPGALWSQAVLPELGVIADPNSGLISPRVSSQTTGADGFYA